MALSPGDWDRLDRSRHEDRQELRGILDRMEADSSRQWESIAKLDNKLGIHIAESDGTHSQPCQTAINLVGKHESESPVHNPKKTVAILATLFSIAGAVGAGISWVIHWIQSLKPAIHPALILVPALFALGCSPASTVYEEDRVLLDLTKQVVAKQRVQIIELEGAIERLKAALTPELLARLLPIAGNLRELNEDAAANVAQMQENWGRPGAPVVHTRETNKKAIGASKEAHGSAGFWASLATGVFVGAGAIIGILKSPAARMIPFVGPIVAAFQPMLAGVEKFMTKAKASGNGEAVTELASSLLAEQQVAKVAKFVSKKLGKVKKRIRGQFPTPLAADDAAAAPPIAPI